MSFRLHCNVMVGGSGRSPLHSPDPFCRRGLNKFSFPGLALCLQSQCLLFVKFWLKGTITKNSNFHDKHMKVKAVKLKCYLCYRIRLTSMLQLRHKPCYPYALTKQVLSHIIVYTSKHTHLCCKSMN